MSDLIDRQAAINDLNDKFHGMISDESMKIYQVIKWLDELPSADLWISCSERCPEHRVYVLVTYKQVYGIPDIGITWYSESEGKWNTSREVLAWMPLPIPYREGGQDGKD